VIVIELLNLLFWDFIAFSPILRFLLLFRLLRCFFWQGLLVGGRAGRMQMHRLTPMPALQFRGFRNEKQTSFMVYEHFL
jgi:hypothetical protein